MRADHLAWPFYFQFTIHKSSRAPINWFSMSINIFIKIENPWKRSAHSSCIGPQQIMDGSHIHRRVHKTKINMPRISFPFLTLPSDFVARGTYSFQLCEINAQSAGKKNARTVWSRIMWESTPSPCLHQHSGPFRGNLCEQVPRFATVLWLWNIFVYFCLDLFFLLLPASPFCDLRQQLSWQNVHGALYYLTKGEDTQSGLWRPHRAIHSDNVSEICEMRNWVGTDKEQSRGGWGSCHVYDDS